MKQRFLAALIAVCTICRASPIETREVHGDSGFCSDKEWSTDQWDKLKLEHWLDTRDLTNASKIHKDGLMPTWQNSIGSWSAKDAPCTRNVDDCDFTKLSHYCKTDPEWTLILTSAYNFAKYVKDVSSAMSLVVQAIQTDITKFPDTYATDNKTVIPGKSPTGADYGTTALSFASAFLGFIPGLNLVGDTAKVGISAATGSMAVASAGITAAGLKGGADQSTEPQFESYAAINDFISNFARRVGEGTNALLDQVFYPNKVSFTENFNVDFIRKSIAGGGFINAPPVAQDLASYRTLIAALSAPGINMLWQWQGVVILKVNKNNFKSLRADFDPCNDKIFQGVKYCDNTGQMFILQRFKQGQKMYDPADHAVSGIDKLGDQHLSTDIVLKASWNSQVHYGPGAAGPTPDDLFSKAIAAGGSPLPLEEYVRFNLITCDFDKLDYARITTGWDTKDVCDSQKDKIMCKMYWAAQFCMDLPAFQKDGKSTFPGETLVDPKQS